MIRIISSGEEIVPKDIELLRKAVADETAEIERLINQGTPDRTAAIISRKRLVIAAYQRLINTHDPKEVTSASA